MIILLSIVHVIVCFFLILVVLLQTGKGADVAAAFGGSTQTAFGARGATTFLSKLTTGSAIVFMFTSLALALLSTAGGSSVVDTAAPAQAAPAAATPAPATPTPAPATPPAAAPTEQAPAPGATSPQSPQSPQEGAQPGSTPAGAETQQPPAGTSGGN